MQPEEWRPVPGYEGWYEASTLGRVRSVRRLVMTRWGWRPRNGKVLTPSIARAKGYLAVRLSRDCIARTVLLHRVIALTFHGPPSSVDVLCRHLDGNPHNNVPENLAWGTLSENARDRVAHGRHNMASKTARKHGHPFDEQNTYIRRTGGRKCRICMVDQARRQRNKENVAA